MAEPGLGRHRQTPARPSLFRRVPLFRPFPGFGAVAMDLQRPDDPLVMPLL